ncbi:uncharacterized protein N7458_005778 [Penicillium daleae]|uniref:Uncharacterized protein n=1 Tax=Penicillium daleae TaxID=63821 RepID=A0AAD6CBC1_9EURO|nr:uncharacterized protein N7458_005778 [Penicillium daleae]KAJ5454822.1 hypothetical protein N7458_005778 [Penicillium daleae]
MKVVYTVIAAFDLITTYNCFVDDAVDGDEIREEGPAWYIHHPKTFPADAGLVMSVGNRLLHHFLPGSHPCKSDLIHLYHNYMVYCTSYLSVTHARNQKSPNTSLKEATQPSIDDLTGGTFAAFHYMRSGNYVQLILHACRLAACYKNILSTSDRRYLYTDTIRRAAVVLQIVEDIRDSRIMDVQVPRRLPLNEYLQSINDDMIKDFIAGELNHAFLIASLELARGGTGVMSLTGDEKEEIMKTLRECYLADEGHLEDIESQKRRLYRLCAMFLKYDIYGYIKKHVLPSTLIQYFLVHGQASREFNMPKDLLSHAVVSMVRQDSCSRSTHVAEELEKVMTTPNEAIDEMEKVLRIFELLQNI